LSILADRHVGLVSIKTKPYTAKNQHYDLTRVNTSPTEEASSALSQLVWCLKATQNTDIS